MTVVEAAPVTSEPTMAVPMGPFPARLRIGAAYDHIDVLVCEVGDATGVEEAWEHSGAMLSERYGLHIPRPGLTVDGSAVVITFAFPAEAASLEFAAMLAAAVRYAATMAAALSDDCRPDWCDELRAYGILGNGYARDPRWLLQGSRIAAWPQQLG